MSNKAIIAELGREAVEAEQACLRGRNTAVGSSGLLQRKPPGDWSVSSALRLPAAQPPATRCYTGRQYRSLHSIAADASRPRQHIARQVEIRLSDC